MVLEFDKLSLSYSSKMKLKEKEKSTTKKHSAETDSKKAS